MQSIVALAGQSTPISTPFPPTNFNSYSICNPQRLLPLQRTKSLALKNSFTRKPTPLQVRAGAEGVEMITEKLGIRVERNPSESRLSELGVKQWPKDYTFNQLVQYNGFFMSFKNLKFFSIFFKFGIGTWMVGMIWWGCPPSNFPWTYSAKETCYLLKGKVKVTPEGANEAVEIQAGDLVVFPKGMSCTWDVSETVDKHYQFE